MGAFPIALMAAATVINVANSLSQGQQAKKQADFQAQQAANHAAIAEQNARDARAAGQAAEQRQRLETAQHLSAQRAAAGAGGVDVGGGSALDSFADTAMLGEYDALAIRNNAIRQGNGFVQQATDFTNQSSQYKIAGQNALTNGAMSSAGSLLGNGGRVAKSWYDYAQANK
jgi:hypothetical protein